LRAAASASHDSGVTYIPAYFMALYEVCTRSSFVLGRSRSACIDDGPCRGRRYCVASSPGWVSDISGSSAFAE
jgi:hypothetical protein